MSARRTFRAFRRATVSLVVSLRLLVMIFAIVTSPLGFSLSTCHCSACECTPSDDGGCCCSTPTTSCCSATSCCSDEGCDNDESIADCECGPCHCELGLSVEPVAMPGINDAAKPIADTSLEITEAIQSEHSEVRMPELAVPLPSQNFHAMHCRWLI